MPVDNHANALPTPRLMTRLSPFKVLSLIPPMTQLNTPYPSTAYLTGFLRSRGIDAVQEDLALATVLTLLALPAMYAAWFRVKR